MKRFINGNLFLAGAFCPGSFTVEEGRFTGIWPKGTLPGQDVEIAGVSAPGITQAASKIAASRGVRTTAEEEIIDLHGARVIPGLIDIHGHGNSGQDFSTCDYEGLTSMAAYLARHGITAFAPASMTMPYDALSRAFSHARQLYSAQNHDCRNLSRLIGINMEGPYFSYGKRGAQNPAYLKAPDIEGFLRLQEDCSGMIKLVDVAPELPGAMEFIREISRTCRVSIAHTEADYETTRRAFLQGASHMTHLFNGMNGIRHRDPGPVLAAYDTPGIFVELICDGVHLLPPVIRMVFELFRGRVVLISDALACCGMQDGRYALGEQEITLKDHHATLADGTLAGSASNLFDMLQNVVSFGIPLEEAILSATLHPARQIGAEQELGSIETGKKADFLIVSESLQLQSVYIGGRPVI